MGNSYKICFLGYRKLREMAQQVIDKLNYQDTTVVMKECAIETLEQVVNEADSEGCQVFVAGSAYFKARDRQAFIRAIQA